MIIVVAAKSSPTSSSTKLSNLNSKKLPVIKCINAGKVPGNYPERKQLKFNERVKCFYYDSDQPIVKPRQYFLKQLNPKSTSETASKICFLESFKLSKYPKESDLIHIEGHVITKNLSFEKRIAVRYTLTEWKTFSDIDAFFVNSIDTLSDRFMFSLRLDKSLLENSTESTRISFAVKYEFLNQVYWDNNSGENYQFRLHY